MRPDRQLPWFDRRTIDLGRDQHVSAFWHCFGVQHEKVTEWEALQMLMASRTWLLPINCANGPTIGHHPQVTWEGMRHYPIVSSCVPCLNINLQTSSGAAERLALKSAQWTGIDLFKLEVLTEDLTDSDDEGCMAVTRRLAEDGWRVMPLLSSRNPEYAEELDDMENVPVVRVMGSPIGSGLGVMNPDGIEEFCSHDTPVVLDGGIGDAKDVISGMVLGCSGFLVNSMLFADGGNPAERLRDLRADLATVSLAVAA